jgi:DNA-binding response OmpR family regulator
MEMRVECCPNCGIDLAKFEAKSFGNITIDEARQLVLNGKPVTIQPSPRDFVVALVRAQGRILTREALANVVGHEGDIWGPGNAVNTYIQRARTALKEADPAFDQIVTHTGLGYSWRFKVGEEAPALRLVA